MILGGGPNRIGQGIEFDYCCVHASFALKELGFETIMVNCNPETVSHGLRYLEQALLRALDPRGCARLLSTRKNPTASSSSSADRRRSIWRCRWHEAGVPIIGTIPDSIDCAEDRERFQPAARKARTCTSRTTARQCPLRRPYADAQSIGYPVLVRPSYVLGGRAMQIVYDEESLQRIHPRKPCRSSQSTPMLIDKFLEDAIEVDVDAVSDGRACVIAGIMEHIEEAGIHSGDSACVLPPYTLSDEHDRCRHPAITPMQLARELKVNGLMNIQFAIKNDTVYVLEVNPRASRTVPFVSKATGVPWAKMAAKVMAGKTLKELGISQRSCHYPHCGQRSRLSL